MTRRPLSRHLYGATVALAWLTLGGCDRDPNQGTLESNVAAAFAPCSANEIKFLATKHNFQLAFRECGDNNFSAYRWSPDGTQLYFQLVFSPYVMDAGAKGKPIAPVATSTPIGPASWVGPLRLVVPVGPGEGGTRNRLAIYDREQQTVFHVDTTLEEVKETQPTGERTTMLALGRNAGVDGLWRMDTATGEGVPAFPWLTTAPNTFTYQPALDLVTLGVGETVQVRQGSDGLVIGTWPNAVRGSMHPDGRYLMLEHHGDAISVFYQRAWDELSPEARERELRRLEKFEAQLAEGTPTTVRPPTLSWVDLHTGRRWMVTSAYGNHFQWYEAAGHYGAFFLWGFEGKQFKRNVALGSFDGRFLSIDKGRDVLGVEPMPEGEDPTYKPPTGVIPAAETLEAAAPPAPAP